MKHRTAPFTEVISSTRIVAPSLAALGAALALSQVSPTVNAATSPLPPIIRPLPKSSVAGDKYVVTQTLKLERPVKFGDWAWDETSAPLTGPVIITVDIASQSLSVFRSGHQIGLTRIIYGDDDKPTPTGAFPITQKSEKHRSNIFVDAPMPYMLRMTNDGISVHGTDKVDPNYATNGCIGIPNGFARRLFDVVALGDRIVVAKARQMRIGDVITTVCVGSETYCTNHG